MSSSANKVTLVLEFNTAGADVGGTVWAYPIAAGELIDGPVALEEIDGARKIIGPVHQDTAMHVYEALCETLRAAGVDFETRVVADD